MNLLFYSIRIHRLQDHRLRCQFVDFQIKFNDLLTFTEPVEIVDFLQKLFENIIASLTEGAPPDSYLRVVLQEPTLRTPISMEFVKLEKFSAFLLSNFIAQRLQSAQFFSFSYLTLNCILQKGIKKCAGDVPFLGDPNKRKIRNFAEYACGRKCLLTIDNVDKMCVARCLLLAKKYIENASESVRKNYKSSKEATQDAEQLYRECGLKPGTKVGLEAISKFQQTVALINYEINVFEVQGFACERIWRGPKQDDKLCILLYKNHCWVITEIRKLWGKKHFCFECAKPYQDDPHKCPNSSCRFCKKIDCENAGTKRQRDVYCVKCNRNFVTGQCFNAHLSIDCNLFYRCSTCEQKVYRAKQQEHPKLCGQLYCSVCQCYRPSGHRFCFIKPYKQPKEKEGDPDIPLSPGDGDWTEDVDQPEEPRPLTNYLNTMTFYWDTETIISEGPTQVPNLIYCCRSDKQEEKFFKGVNCFQAFVDWIFNYEIDRKMTRLYLAHNSKAFDSFLLLNQFYKYDLKCKLIIKDNKILELSYKPKKIIFRDSLSFITMPLAAFAKAFGTKEEKGFFPLMLNSETNLENNAGLTAGQFPKLDDFLYRDINPQKREELIKWHAEQTRVYKEENKQYDLKQQLYDYCKQDVVTLLTGCEIFRKQFRETATDDLDPFLIACTLTSASQIAFRQKFYKPEKLGGSILAVSDHGIDPKTKHSAIADIWLNYIRQQYNVRIEKEVPVGKYRLDGLVKNPTVALLKDFPEAHGKPIALEYNGCIYHGCKRCFPDGRLIEPLSKKSMARLAMETGIKNHYLRSRGYFVLEKYDCSFKDEILSNVTLKNFISDTNRCTHEPLAPRLGLYGGRTNALRLYVKCAEDEGLYYYDVNSLYPYVNSEMEFPIGPPKIIWHNFLPDPSKYFGLVKCIVIAPRGLYLPVLPYRSSNGKLTFPACAKCCDELRNSPKCPHSDNERSWLGVFTTVELKAAIERGYRITHICVVWHWSRSTKLLFREYLLQWIIMKLKASGLPEDLQDECDKTDFVNRFNERYGVNLKVSDFQKNVSLKTLAKLVLVSFWGRFCCKIGGKNKICDSYDEVQSIFQDPNCKISEVTPVSDTKLLITYNSLKDFAPVVPNISIIIGVLTTSYARLELLKYIELAFKMHGQNSVTYFDTDSLIVKQNINADPLPTGQFVGDLKMELASDYGTNAMGKIFFASAPKSYGLYVVNEEKNTAEWLLKVKGFRACARFSETITPEKMLEKLLKHPQNREVEDENPLEVEYPRQIRRDRRTGRIFTQPMKKKFKITYDKRVLVNDYCTLPYGFA